MSFIFPLENLPTEPTHVQLDGRIFRNARERLLANKNKKTILNEFAKWPKNNLITLAAMIRSNPQFVTLTTYENASEQIDNQQSQQNLAEEEENSFDSDENEEQVGPYYNPNMPENADPTAPGGFLSCLEQLETEDDEEEEISESHEENENVYLGQIRLFYDSQTGRVTDQNGNPMEPYYNPEMPENADPTVSGSFYPSQEEEEIPSLEEEFKTEMI